MGERGPAKKPTEQHKANGTYKPGRHASPTLPVVIPKMPPDMGTVAQATWKHITSELEKARLVAELDQKALRLLAESFALYLEAVDEVATRGITIEQTNKAGFTNTVVNPAVRVRSDAWKQVVLLLKQFGMTPSSRTGIAFNDSSDGSDEEQRVADILGIVG